VKRTPLRRRTPLRANRGRSMSKEWRQARTWTEDRAGGRCEAKAPGCVGRGAHAHHILRRSQGGPDDPSNLAWVCPPCHAYIHANPAWAYEHGLLRRRTPPLVGENHADEAALGQSRPDTPTAADRWPVLPRLWSWARYHDDMINGAGQ